MNYQSKKVEPFYIEKNYLNECRNFIKDDDFSKERLTNKFMELCENYNHLINDLSIITKISNRMQTKLNTANEKLAEAIASKDKFFSIIGHDLKNPMQGLMNHCFLISYNLKKRNFDELAKQIENINKGVRLAIELLDNLLHWSKTQLKKMDCIPEKIDLTEIADKNIDLLAKNAEAKKTNLYSKIEKNTYICADNNMITTVIRNLSSNSIKFTPENGEVYYSSKPTGKYIEVSVNDTGVGMSKEKMNGLFKLGTNTSTKGTAGEKGTGLGLLLCKEFVEMNGGKIWVESEIGKGSTFKFTVPSAIA
ncbi:MAG: HAMP domain-containing sensor histidine kinase [Bacteroidota bacterium]